MKEILKEEECFLKCLHPFTKLLFVLGISILSVIYKNINFIIFVSIIYIILSIVGGEGATFLRSYLKLFLFFGVFFTLISALFNGSPDEIAISLWKIQLRVEGLRHGISLSSIILSVSGGILLFMRLTNIEDFMLALEKAGLPPRAAYMVVATFQIIPDMKDQSARIMDAQKSRGIESDGNILTRVKMLLPTTVTLLLASMKNAEETSLALEVRGFGVKSKKTRIRKLNFNIRDFIVIGATIIFTVFGIII